VETHKTLKIHDVDVQTQVRILIDPDPDPEEVQLFMKFLIFIKNI
jgi:hypothetical protein